MPADTAQLDFLHYLMCDLPLGYPLKTSITKLLDSSLMSTRRELLHQQSDFLDLRSIISRRSRGSRISPR